MGIKLYICPLKERMKRVKKKNWIVSSFHESFSGFAGKESQYTHEAEEKDSFCVCVCKCIWVDWVWCGVGVVGVVGGADDVENVGPFCRGNFDVPSCNIVKLCKSNRLASLTQHTLTHVAVDVDLTLEYFFNFHWPFWPGNVHKINTSICQFSESLFFRYIYNMYYSSFRWAFRFYTFHTFFSFDVSPLNPSFIFPFVFPIFSRAYSHHISSKNRSAFVILCFRRHRCFLHFSFGLLLDFGCGTLYFPFCSHSCIVSALDIVYICHQSMFHLTLFLSLSLFSVFWCLFSPYFFFVWLVYTFQESRLLHFSTWSLHSFSC